MSSEMLKKEILKSSAFKPNRHFQLSLPTPRTWCDWCLSWRRWSAHIYNLHDFKDGSALFRNKRFALNEMFQRNTSKFAIFYVSLNPCSFFRFSFRATLYFYLMNALVYVDIDQGIHKGKSKVARNEKRKKLHGFSYT